MGVAGLEEFTQLKTVLFHTGKRTHAFLPASELPIQERGEASDTVGSH